MSDLVGIDVEVGGADAHRVVQLAGYLDASNAAEVRRRTEAAAEGADELTVDLRQLDFLDSSGLGIFVAIHKQRVGVGRALRLLQPQPTVSRVFEVSGLNHLFTIV